MDYGCSFEPAHQGGFNKYPQSMFLSLIHKIMFTLVIQLFLQELGFSKVFIAMTYLCDVNPAVWMSSNIFKMRLLTADWEFQKNLTINKHSQCLNNYGIDVSRELCYTLSLEESQESYLTMTCRMRN